MKFSVHELPSSYYEDKLGVVNRPKLPEIKHPVDVLVASLVLNQPWLGRFLEQLNNLQYPEKLLRYAFLENTHINLLHEWCENRNCWIKNADPTIPDRFEKLAQLRNIIIEEAHPIGNEHYVLWIDSDIVNFPPTLVTDLMKYDAPVIAPSVYIEGTNQFYDTLAFRDLRGHNFPAFDLPYRGLVEVSSVGACLLVASRLYRQSCLRHRGGDSEQATFCSAVRNIGERVYVDFNIRIEHANLKNYGRDWH